MAFLRSLCFVLVSTIVVACGSTAPNVTLPEPNQAYLDDQFTPNVSIESIEEVFAISDEMKLYVRERLDPMPSASKKVKRLVQDLFDPNVLNIQYKAGANISAQEVFEHGSANCLSLTLLSYILAREAELNATLMDVKVQENWTFSQGVSLLNGHVNLKVNGERAISSVNLSMEADSMTIDFLPMLRSKTLGSRPLTKKEFLALYYNNRGADALLAKNYDLSYAYFKAATKNGPYLSSTWGNLAGLYSRMGYFTEAERLYNISAQLDPNNLNTQENLAVLYTKTERQEQADIMLDKIHRKRLDNPYYHAMLAREDYENGKYLASIQKLKKAIHLNNTEHLFLFDMARSHLRLNNYHRANTYLKRAKRLASEGYDKKIYQSKISMLQQLLSSNNPQN